MTFYSFPGYDDFRCLAAACPDSCCVGWDVVLDDDTITRYRAMDGTLGVDLRARMRVDEDGDTVFAQQDGRCPFLRADGLCRIQCACGEDALSETCRRFPRLYHAYADFTERCLSLACPQAAHIILGRELPPIPSPETRDETLRALIALREEWIDTLTQATIPLPEAVCRVLRDAAAVQGFDPPGCERNGAEALFARLAQLDAMTDNFRLLSKKPQREPHIQRRTAGNLCVYYLYNYVLQAVADNDVLFAVQMMCAALTFASFAKADAADAARLFCKEVEHDYDNLDTLRDWFDTDPAFAPQTFLRIWENVILY